MICRMILRLGMQEKSTLDCLLIYLLYITYTFIARRYSAIYAVVVCLSVRLSQVDVLLKRLNVESRKQRHTIAQGN